MLNLSRRKFLGRTAAAGAAVAGGLPLLSEATAAGLNLPAALPQGVRDNAIMDALPGKRPLIKLSYRPPNYETPVSSFSGPITANEDFFVRYHLADIPQVDPAKWSLTVEGGQNPLTMDLATLRQMPFVEIAAVCQCSGNRRG